MENFVESERQVHEAATNRLEYIRCRLFIMALLPCFEELVKKKVHLYLEGGFNEVLCKKLNIPRRKFCNYLKIAKAMVKIREGGDFDFFKALADEYSEKYEIEFAVLPENKILLEELLEEFAG